MPVDAKAIVDGCGRGLLCSSAALHLGLYEAPGRSAFWTALLASIVVAVVSATSCAADEVVDPTP